MMPLSKCVDVVAGVQRRGASLAAGQSGNTPGN